MLVILLLMTGLVMLLLCDLINVYGKCKIDIFVPCIIIS